MSRVVGIRFKAAGKVYYFDPGELSLVPGDGAVVETARGVELGTVTSTPREIPEEEIKAPLKKVLRKATEEDLARRRENEEKSRRAFAVGQQKIAAHGLPMKLVEVEHTLDGSKIIFYFTAENRVDFRELVKDLASAFRTRIELRQIGVRDEAKLLGGLGPCGRQLCCQAFLGDFVPVSIRMAKEQNLSLNPAKISGICGRLMCCLNYESEQYREAKRAAAAQPAAAVGQPAAEEVPGGDAPATPAEGRPCAACPAAAGAAPCCARGAEAAEPAAPAETAADGETAAKAGNRKRRRRRSKSGAAPAGQAEAGQPAPPRESGAQGASGARTGQSGTGTRPGRSGQPGQGSQRSQNGQGGPGGQGAQGAQYGQGRQAGQAGQGSQGAAADGGAGTGSRSSHRRRRRKAKPGAPEGGPGGSAGPAGSPAE